MQLLHSFGEGYIRECATLSTIRQRLTPYGSARAKQPVSDHVNRDYADVLKLSNSSPYVCLGNMNHPTALSRVLGVPELLAIILNHCERRELAIFCRVCLAWDAAIGTLTYFSTLVIYRPQYRYGALSLSRGLSRGQSRRVTILIPGMSAGDRESIVSVLRQHSQRIVKLAVCKLDSLDIDLILAVVLQGMPILEELALQHRVTNGDARDKESPPASFNIGNLVRAAPQLRRLVSSGVTISGPYDDAAAVDIIEFASRPPDHRGIAASLWHAPWKPDTTVHGVAIREGSGGGRQPSWVATAWCGTPSKIILSETALTGNKVHSLTHTSGEAYRRIVIQQAVHEIAFSHDGITVISMSLYFWGLVRQQVGDIRLSNLIAAHFMMVEMHDDSEEPSQGRLDCPRLRHVGLEVEKIEGFETEDWPWEHYIPCSRLQLVDLATRIVCAPEYVTIDVLGDGFDVLTSAAENTDSMIRILPDIKDFQTWIYTF